MSTCRDSQHYARFAACQRVVTRRTFAGLAVMLAVGVGLVVTASAHGGDEATPAGTVQSFLITAFDSDGFDSCHYLTRRARAEVDRAVAEPHTPCEVVIPFARLTLGRDRVTDEAAVKRLGYRVTRQGPTVSVTVEAGGAGHAFRLKRADPAELAEFRAPATPWRIDGGVASLVHRSPAAPRAAAGPTGRLVALRANRTQRSWT